MYKQTLSASCNIMQNVYSETAVNWPVMERPICRTDANLSQLWLMIDKPHTSLPALNLQNDPESITGARIGCSTFNMMLTL